MSTSNAPSLPPPAEDRILQPTGSKAILAQDAGATSIFLPSIGLRRGNGFILCFGLIWATCSALATIQALRGTLRLEGGGIPSVTHSLLLLSLCWAIGLGFTLAGIHLARRKVVFIATADGLFLLQSGPLGKKERQFPRADIVAIRFGHAKSTTNGQPDPQLEVRLTSGQTVGLLVNRDPDELRWLAYVLRQALIIPAYQPAPGATKTTA